MPIIEVHLNLIEKYGLTTGIIANLARHRAERAESVMGPFTLPASWVAESVGIGEKTASAAIRKLEKSGYLTCISGDGRSGQAKLYQIEKKAT